MTLQLKNKDILYVEPNSDYYGIMARILLPDVDSKMKNNINIERAVNYALAIRKVKSRVEEIIDKGSDTGKKYIGKPFDIIFCEYELGEGKTAQDLLEKLRKDPSFPLETIFIMVASERFRDRVMAVLEFAPDAYIIKGNTPMEMEKRILRAVHDRAELIHIYSAIRDKKYEEALKMCDDYVNQKKRLSPYVMKLTGFILLELHDYERAKAAYQKIIALEKAEAIRENREAKPIPYAQNGLAKSLYHLGETEEAEGILTDLVKDHPDFMEGYDLLSDIYKSTDRPKESQKVLEQATAKSPQRFDRQKLLGLTALDNNDLEGAKAAFKKLTTDGKFSNSGHPENFVHLAEIHTKEGDTKAAELCVRRVKEEFKGTEQADVARFCAATMEHSIYSKKGDATKAKLALGEAISLHKNGVNLGEMSERMQVNFACECIDEGHSEIGTGILGEVIQNSTQKDIIAKRAEQLLGENPAALATVKNTLQKTQEDINADIEEALELFESGQVSASKKRIDILFRESPNNPDILAKAAYIYFGCIDLSNPDISLYNSAKKHLGNLTRIKSTHPDREELLKKSLVIDGAIGLQSMRTLAQKNKNSPTTLVSAIKAYFLYINTKGFHEKIFLEACSFLHLLIKQDPNNPDIAVLQGQEERIRKRHNVASGNIQIEFPTIEPLRVETKAEKPVQKPTPKALEKPVIPENLPPIDDDDFAEFIL